MLPAWLLLFAVDRQEEYSLAELFLVLLVLAVLVRRTAAPFLNEILLLEKNPLRSRNPQAMTAGKRSVRAARVPIPASLINQGLVVAAWPCC